MEPVSGMTDDGQAGMTGGVHCNVLTVDEQANELQMCGKRIHVV